MAGGEPPRRIISKTMDDVSDNQNKSKKPQNMKRTLDDPGAESSENDKRARNTSPCSDRFFILSATDGSTLSSVNPFLLGKTIKVQVGSVSELRKLRNGTILVKTADEKQAKALQKVKKIGEVHVKVEVHRSLNYCKGVVKSRELGCCSNEEILHDLRSQGVVGCSNISVKSDSGERRSTNTYILTFHTTTPPKYVYVSDYLRIPVAVYIPNPLRCFNCQKFGHTRSNCKGQKVCASCATPGHDATDCTSPRKCANCGGAHTSYSKECPAWLKEKEIQQVRVERGISFPEARKIVQSRSAAKSNCSYVTVASAKEQLTKHTSTAVQTDLTWPSCQSEPSFVVTLEKSVQTDGLSPSVSRAGTHKQSTDPTHPCDLTPPPRPQRKGEHSASGRGARPKSKSKPQDHVVAQRRTASLSPDKSSQGKRGIVIHRPPKKLGEDPVKIHNKYGVLDDDDTES